LIELLRAAARREPRRAAVITNDRTISYAELVGVAENVADSLVSRGIARFGIVEQDAGTVIALLSGASLAGVEACVYPPIDVGDTAQQLATRFDHEVLVSDERDLGDDLEVLTPAELCAPSIGSAGAGAPEQPPPERPLLVLTTGTTGAPRGVRHDWSRVVRSASHIVPSPEQRWLLAYGLQQFGGLQILVQVTAAQATLIAPAPRRPREGLAAMRKHGADRASATPTFWRFLLAELRSDGGPVPALRQITVSGEAVPDHLLADLREMFPDARCSQIYAANESGPLRSVRDGRPGIPVSLLDGGDEADIAFKVVDDQLWVRSRIGMLGYYGEPPVDPDAWRPTGDLVEIDDGRVMFRGRASDIINVGGVKVHPLPIEERIGSLPGVAIARVYGRPNAMTGAIVAVEVVGAPGADTEALDGAIRAACEDLPAAARPRSIRFVDALVTTGNKIARASADGR
jgi:acyl-CoA synthetase (AMP-forming)/AMP-acid ligase II